MHNAIHCQRTASGQDRRSKCSRLIRRVAIATRRFARNTRVTRIERFHNTSVQWIFLVNLNNIDSERNAKAKRDDG